MVRCPGTNGFATAALVCGLLAFIPVAAILAVVFGIIALRQLGQVSQREGAGPWPESSWDRWSFSPGRLSR